MVGSNWDRHCRPWNFHLAFHRHVLCWPIVLCSRRPADEGHSTERTLVILEQTLSSV